MDQLIRLTHLTFTYPHAEQPTLQNVDLTVNQGDFLVIAGDSGSGKTTLLRHLKKELLPNGQREGQITITGQSISEMTKLQSAQTIGYVSQNPRHQPVMPTVIEELAFSLENIGCPSREINRRIAEMTTYLGLDHWLHQSIETLSGGQLQLVNLAAVLILRPKVILLDEPTAQLDPLMTRNLMAILARIHQELGMTIVMTEHNLSLPITLATRMVLLNQRTIAADGSPASIMAKMFYQPTTKRFVPEVPALFLTYYPQASPLPLSVMTAQRLIRARKFRFKSVPHLTHDLKTAAGEQPILAMKNVSFSFNAEQNVVDHLNLFVNKGDWLTIVGKNGSGKSTLLSLMAGLRKPQFGKIKLNRRLIWKLSNLQRIQQLSFLSQEPTLQFGQETVIQELIVQGQQLEIKNVAERAARMLKDCRLTHLKSQNPFDLSGGQQRLLGLAIALMAEPVLLILDEPTNGLDPNTKYIVGKLLKDYQRSGGTIVMATHDMAFAAEFSDHCGFMFDGDLETILPRRQFFSENFFFTTAVNRLLRDQVPTAILVDDVVAEKGDVN
ncbi:ABC transporter ATP-binding protein [Lentilactobacillus raoultii]|uniref:ABC transporter ATP-binding protein n=1 Tax=Lentilactobacillus raoultii TaxID=1987503 RepID=A0ABW3PQ30_9LACO|nr:ABC transporter ATP-binding protein [Lentilactobacillus raoultii]